MWPVKFTEKQAAAWEKVGESILEMWVRVTDLSLPDDVVLDRAWLATSMKTLTALFDRWAKTLPGVQRNSENAARRKERAKKAVQLFPVILVALLAVVTPARDSGIAVNFAMEMEIVERPVPGQGLSDADLALLDVLAKKTSEEEPN
jgi:hypothetical protein